MIPWRIFPFPPSPLLLLVPIFYLNVVSRIILAPFLPLIEGELRLGHGEAGSLFLFIAAGYCTGLLGSGVVSSRLNHRRAILLSTVTVGVAMLAMARSASVSGLHAGLVLLGFSAGLYLPSGIATVTEHIGQEHWGKAIAIHELAPNLAFVTAPLFAEVLLRLISWRGILAILGIFAMLMGALFLVFGQGASRKSEPPRFETMAYLLRNPSFWIMAALFSVSIGAGMGVYTLMPLFLVSEMGMDRGLANTLTGLSRVSGIVIVFFSGWITDRIGHSRALALFLTTTGTLTLLLGLIHGRITTPVLVFLQSASIPCFFPAGFSMVSWLFSSPLRNLAVSMITIVGVLFGMGVIPSAIGHLAEAFSFSAGFSLLGILALAILPLLRYSGPYSSTDER